MSNCVGPAGSFDHKKTAMPRAIHTEHALDPVFLHGTIIIIDKTRLADDLS
ncbi:MAG: hypothetical protein ACKO96_45970 [Flammeovirgaceae bacterium]